MTMFRRQAAVRVLLLFAVGAVTTAGAVAARGVVADTGILNQVQVQDPTGDAGGGPDLSSLTVTSYSDGTISFAVGFANRDYIHSGETVQIFIDLNNDNQPDLNLSIWPTGQPSYLARWTGTGWSNVRQLAELVQTSGSLSVRLSLSGLRDAAGVPIASTIGVGAGAWASGFSSKTQPNDFVPDGPYLLFQVQPASTPSTTPATGGTGVLNRTQAQDPVGDAQGGGPDLSSLTVTTYADGTISFAVGLANRDVIQRGESVGVFVDLNDDNQPDLNLSILSPGQPSELDRWNGTGWTGVRDLTGLVQGNGSISVRLSLAELSDAAGVPVGSAVAVLVAAWPAGAGTAATDASDLLPDNGEPSVVHSIHALPPSNPSTPSNPLLGKTVSLKRRTRTHNCTLGPLPDRRCSPGAYYSKLTKGLICSPALPTSTLLHVTNTTKHTVEREYGLAAKGYGKTLEIDHIVPLQLGGSNDIANLYPEKATFANHSPGYHLKDKLENRLTNLVCAGQLSLSAARQQIAANWEKLYRKVYGVAPTG